MPLFNETCSMNWYLSDDTVNNVIYSENSDHFQQNYYNNCTTCHGSPYVSNSRTRLRRSDHSPSGDLGFQHYGIWVYFIYCVWNYQEEYILVRNEFSIYCAFLRLYEDLIALMEVRLLLKTKLVRNIWDISICTLLANPTLPKMNYWLFTQL